MFGRRFRSLSFVLTIGATLLVGIPTVLLPNPLEEQMRPNGVEIGLSLTSVIAKLGYF